ncbi:MAG TPA: hypothetical protein VIO58_08530 [Candidatus Methanoperedens sp.]
MKSANLLGVILASVLIISFAIVLVNKDVLMAEPEKPPAFLSIREIDVRPVDVTSSQIEVNITAYIDHFGGKTRNGSMLIRAISSDTGLLATQVSTPIDAEEPGTQKTLAVSQKLKVDRNGGYDLKILLFDNGTIRDSGSVGIRGLSAITSFSKRSGIVLNNIDFTVGSVSAGKVSIKSDIYLENKGPEPSDNLKMIVKAREAASNLLADKTITETGVIASEATAIKSVQLVVPDEYNYMVVVELWKEDVLINTWEKPVLLAPSKTVPKESVEKKVDIEVSKFVREEGVPAAQREQGATSTMQKKEPGFEVFAALAALMIAVIVLRRRS